MSDCIFCKIVAGELPCYKVYEDSDFIGFLDIHPIAKGHVQLIPKVHYRWTYEIPIFGQYFEVAKKVALACQKAVESQYISFITFGQEVNHAHIWIVPRFNGDLHEGHGINTDCRLEFNQEQYLDIQQKIVQNII
jgi:histidine triad (HIT) family protein